MANFKNIVTGVIEASSYKGLPQSSSNRAGIIKIDGITLVINKDGVVSVNLQNINAESLSHINNEDMHVSSEDRLNLQKLDRHLNKNNEHFNIGEKAEWKSTFNEMQEELQAHLKKKHLSSDDVTELLGHISNGSIHFDSIEQKDKMTNLLECFMFSEFSEPNKMLVTNKDGYITLSSVDVKVLEYIQGLTAPLTDILNEYALIGHEHEMYNDTIKNLSNHKENSDLHFNEGEKVSLIEDIQNIKYSMDDMISLEGEILKCRDMSPQRKLSVRYIEYSIGVPIGFDDRGLSLVNFSIYKNGENIAPQLPASSITTDMNFDESSIMKWLNGDTSTIAYTQECVDNTKCNIVIDIGEITNDVSHLRVHNALDKVYLSSIRVSEDGERWFNVFDTSFSRAYKEDKYGKIHILNYEAYVDFLHK